ncbi:MAG: Gfo/Idh/MocA family oxidoreductase [Spirochaetales bacterium]|nr:Gfo/Idh/MocA family oxidoreductase [Spirochaetales bacterium]
MIRTAIVSFAHLHGEAYISNLRAARSAEFVGVYDPDAERRTIYAERLDVPTFESLDEMLGAGIDAAIVCSENSRHRGDVEDLSRAGVHILCEKPLAVTADDGAAMVAACARAGVLLMTAFPMRFNAPLVAAERNLADGLFGTLTSCVATNQGQLPKRHRAWFVDPVLAGGGAVTDHTVHLVDVMRWFTRSEVESVYAIGNRVAYADDAVVETGGLVSLRFANGVDVSIDCSWSRPLNYPTWGGLTMRLVTDRGAVDLDAFAQNNTVYGLAEQHTRWDNWGSDANQAMIDEFIAAVVEKRTPAVTGEDGLRAVEVVEAAYRSIASGGVETVVRR